MGEWKGDMVGLSRKTVAGRKSSWQEQSRTIFTCIHFPTTASGNEIGDEGAEDLSVALAKCPNLHTLNLSGQWLASCVECGAMACGMRDFNVRTGGGRRN